MELADVEVMNPPTAAGMDPPTEVTMKELVYKYRPVRQRTLRVKPRETKPELSHQQFYYTQPPHSK